MTGNGQVPAVVPPMGVRGPLGGGAAPTLGVVAPAPQQQFAPVPPVQPAQPQVQQNAAPPWAATPAPVQPQPPAIPPEIEGYIVQGLQNGAPLFGSEGILHYFPQATPEAVRALAQRHGLQVNENVQLLTQLPPIAEAMAPQAQVSVQAGVANEQVQAPAPTDVKQAQRVTKKHHPLILAALQADPNATPEHIAAALHIPVEGTRKVVEDMRRELALKTQFGAAAPTQLQPDVHTATASAMMQPQQPASVEAMAPQLSPSVQRVLAIMADLEVLAQARGYDYLELESASAALCVQSRR